LKTAKTFLFLELDGCLLALLALSQPPQPMTGVPTYRRLSVIGGDVASRRRICQATGAAALEASRRNKGIF